MNFGITQPIICYRNVQFQKRDVQLRDSSDDQRCWKDIQYFRSKFPEIPVPTKLLRSTLLEETTKLKQDASINTFHGGRLSRKDCDKFNLVTCLTLGKYKLIIHPIGPSLDIVRALYVNDRHCSQFLYHAKKPLKQMEILQANSELCSDQQSKLIVCRSANDLVVFRPVILPTDDDDAVERGIEDNLVLEPVLNVDFPIYTISMTNGSLNQAETCTIIDQNGGIWKWACGSQPDYYDRLPEPEDTNDQQIEQKEEYLQVSCTASSHPMVTMISSRSFVTCIDYRQPMSSSVKLVDGAAIVGHASRITCITRHSTQPWLFFATACPSSVSKPAETLLFDVRMSAIPLSVVSFCSDKISGSTLLADAKTPVNIEPSPQNCIKHHDLSSFPISRDVLLTYSTSSYPYPSRYLYCHNIRSSSCVDVVAAACCSSSCHADATKRAATSDTSYLRSLITSPRVIGADSSLWNPSCRFPLDLNQFSPDVSIVSSNVDPISDGPLKWTRTGFPTGCRCQLSSKFDMENVVGADFIYLSKRTNQRLNRSEWMKNLGDDADSNDGDDDPLHAKMVLFHCTSTGDLYAQETAFDDLVTSSRFSPFSIGGNQKKTKKTREPTSDSTIDKKILKSVMSNLCLLSPVQRNAPAACRYFTVSTSPCRLDIVKRTRRSKLRLTDSSAFIPHQICSQHVKETRLLKSVFLNSGLKNNKLSLFPLPHEQAMSLYDPPASSAEDLTAVEASLSHSSLFASHKPSDDDDECPKMSQSDEIERFLSKNWVKLLIEMDGYWQLYDMRLASALKRKLLVPNLTANTSNSNCPSRYTLQDIHHMIQHKFQVDISARDIHSSIVKMLNKGELNGVEVELAWTSSSSSDQRIRRRKTKIRDICFCNTRLVAIHDLPCSKADCIILKRFLVKRSQNIVEIRPAIHSQQGAEMFNKAAAGWG